MEVISDFDIVIIGGGAAGLRAAIAATETNPNLKIALISKVYPTRSHTVAAEGGIAASIKEDDSQELHAYDTIKGSDYLADQDAVEFFVKHCADEIYLLDKWGCPWSRDENGNVAVRLFGGMNRKRAVYATDKTGFYILHSLYERTLQYKNIQRFDEWFVTKIFKNKSGITGLFALDIKKGKLSAFTTKSIIMATGGPGQIYGHTTNSAISTGDGIALALNAGASLKDMELVQFHPTSLPGSGILITEAARAEGAYLLNNKNERFLINYMPDKMEMGPRDMVTRAIISEYHAGRGIEGPHGLYVNLDLRHLGKKVIEEKLPQVKELALTYLNIDPVKSPIPVTPAQHYFMGGIHTNINTETNLPGLYASGENACISINGANRLGSNSLAICLIFGKVSGEQAAKHINRKTQTDISIKEINEAKQELDQIIENKGSENVYELTKEMQKIMDTHAGIRKEEKSLQEGLEKIKKLKLKTKKIQITQKTLYCNYELMKVIELNNMLNLAETVLLSAIERKESRGAHHREDYPERNDKKYLVHHIISKHHNDYQITKIPVVITKWQPEKRTY